jgi:hypothetical protein
MISISADVRQVSRSLTTLQQKQVPFATARALNETAYAAASAVTKQLPSIFDRPTPFTRNAIAVQAANKRTLTARVFVKDKQAEYLETQETGGQGRPRKTAFVVPKAIGTNQYGNIPRGALQRAKNRKGVFVGTVGGVGGFFYRPPLKPGQTKADQKRVVMLTRFVRTASYTARFGFKARVTTIARRVAPVAFRQALAKALATARG